MGCKVVFAATFKAMYPALRTTLPCSDRTAGTRFGSCLPFYPSGTKLTTTNREKSDKNTIYSRFCSNNMALIRHLKHMLQRPA
jgi:hypothetical protein